MSLNKLEDNLNFLVNGRRPQFFGNFKLLIQEIQKQKQYQHQENQS